MYNESATSSRLRGGCEGRTSRYSNLISKKLNIQLNFLPENL
jgi:hypothetical protein